MEGLKRFLKNKNTVTIIGVIFNIGYTIFRVPISS